MLKVLDISQGKILAVQAHGKLTHDDYTEVLVPSLEKIFKEHEKARLLYVLGHEYDGYTAGAAWEDLKFGLRRFRDFERCAVVSDNKLVRGAVHMFGGFISGDVQLFSNDQLAEAEAWIQE